MVDELPELDLAKLDLNLNLHQVLVKYLKAEKILAKHDENYMPPEVKEAMQGN